MKRKIFERVEYHLTPEEVKTAIGVHTEETTGLWQWAKPTDL